MNIIRIFPGDKFKYGSIPNEDIKYLNKTIQKGMIWIEEKKYYKITDVFGLADHLETKFDCKHIIKLKLLNDNEFQKLIVLKKIKES